MNVEQDVSLLMEYRESQNEYPIAKVTTNLTDKTSLILQDKVNNFLRTHGIRLSDDRIEHDGIIYYIHPYSEEVSF
tara:strand:+ start:470 stop:697 length:228 start_codon:yes stop_codon:yes gene_type:complete